MQIFYGSDLYQYLEGCIKTLEQEVINEEKNRLLNVDEVAYIDYLVKKFTIEPLCFNWDGLYITEKEQNIPACDFPPGYHVHSGKFYPKLTITYHLPFEGNHILLGMQPSTFIMWTMDIVLNKNLNEISFNIINWNNDAEKIKHEVSGNIDKIKKQSSNSTEQVKQYNNNLIQKASDIVSRRKTELLNQTNLLKSLGIPIKQANNVPETFSVPIQKKQIIVQKPPSSSLPYTPEPELSKDVYLQILTVCQDFGIAMERQPSIYQGKGEEALRDLFLMQLSPHFYSVTGETFNKNGKTDILIKHEGRNIFVGECKFWRGEKLHHEAIDQILSYLTWRESKAAIIYFVDNKNLQPVLDKIENETSKHNCHVKTESKNGEAWFNYHFHLLNDNTRGIDLAILVFHFND